jgi:UDP-glucose 4-epimerase
LCIQINSRINKVHLQAKEILAMRALVTGGAGFIGSNIVRLLIEEGHRVTVLDNLLSGYADNLAPFPQVAFIQGDIRNPEQVEQAVQDVDVIFHLAASVGNRRAIEHPLDDSEINVMGTLRILEAARQHGVQKVVISSSAGIFGELKTLPIREDHPIEPISPYGASKLAAEKHGLAYSYLYDMDVVALRYFNVYGVNQRYDAYGNVIPIFAYRILRGEPIIIFGDGEQTRDFINVRDVAQANYKAAMAEGVSGAFNLGSASSVTINHLAAMMYKAVGQEPQIQYGPPRPGDVRDSLADISAAHAAFGFTPSVTLDEGLPEYMQWAKGVLI